MPQEVVGFSRLHREMRPTERFRGPASGFAGPALHLAQAPAAFSGRPSWSRTCDAAYCDAQFQMGCRRPCNYKWFSLFDRTGKTLGNLQERRKMKKEERFGEKHPKKIQT